MNEPFLISMRLYLEKQLPNAALQQTKKFFAYKEFDNRSGFIISEPTSATIETQFRELSVQIFQLIEIIKAYGHVGECVFSVCIRAYTYVPEINFPSDLVQVISSIGATIDVDFIDMII